MRCLLLIVFCPALFVSCAKEKVDESTLFLYAKAQALYAEGDFTETAKILNGVENFSPALIIRGKSRYFCGEDTRAETDFRRALHLNPSAAEAALFLARLLRDCEKDKDAKILTESLIRNNPQDIRALRLASDLASARGDSEAASAFLDRAVEASTEAALVFIDRARLRWTAGNNSGALEDLARAEILLPPGNSLSGSISALRLHIASSVNGAARKDQHEKE
jgi:tetratricopeptide (TPR) repeat protein